MPFVIIIGLLFLLLKSRSSSTLNVPRNIYGSSALGVSKNDAQIDGRTNAKLAVNDSAGFNLGLDFKPNMGKPTLDLAKDFKGLFQQWKWWIQLPVKSVVPFIENVQYGTGSDATVPFTLDSVERRTDDRHFDVTMRCFMDLLSVDTNLNPVEPVKFKIGSYFGYVPAALTKDVDDRLLFIINQFKGSPPDRRNSAIIDEVRKFYFSVIGKPTHNLYGELWTRSLQNQNWVIRMYQGYLWKLVESFHLREFFPSRKFPLTESDNKLTTGRNGMPKVDYDGYSNVVIDSDTIGRSLVSSYVSSKLLMGKNALIAKLFK